MGGVYGIFRIPIFWITLSAFIAGFYCGVKVAVTGMPVIHWEELSHPTPVPVPAPRQR